MKRWWSGLVCAALMVILAMVLPAAAVASRGATSTDSHRARPLTHTHPLLGTEAQSLNWSGYDVADGHFSSVTATWTQPRVRSSGSTFSIAGFWVGLDGDGSNTVEQIGTEGYSEGVVGYDAWYEMYPDSPVTIGMSIHAGDVLTGTVTCSIPASFTLSLVNHTTGATFTTTQPMSVLPALASAEIIVEAPSSSNGIVPLADFTLCEFTECAIDGQPIGDYDWTSIDMVTQHGASLDAALPLSADGAGFGVTTDLVAPTTTVQGADRRWHNVPVELRFVADDCGTGVAFTEYSLDDGTTWTKGSEVTIPAPADHSGDGTQAVLYRSTDNVGNLEETRVCHVGVDTQRPTPLAPRAAFVLRGHMATLHFTIGDPRPGSPTARVTIVVRNGRGAVVRKAVLPSRAVDASLAYRFVCRLARGRYSFSVAATDAAGNRQTAVATSTLVVH